jgi:hypothetical protein
MQRDHGSYMTSHDQLADTFQRLSAQLDSTFVDGGIQSRFDTCNSTFHLQNGHCLEVLRLLDRPSTDGKAIAKIVKIEICGDESGIEVEWVEAAAIDGESGIVAVHVMTTKGVVRLDYLIVGT